MTIVFAFSEGKYFCILNSTFHDLWVRKYASTLETRLRYIPTDCFETFPFPNDLEDLENVGETYHEHRRQIMLARQEGLTSTYNRFHNPKEIAEDILRLRELHVDMDHAVASAYGWGDLNLDHGFHETAASGGARRFTVSESARREILSRLLKLNHERYEEEQKLKDEGGGMREEGRKSKVKGRKSKSKSANDGQIGMF
jgi:hypothetical protein